MVTYPRPTSASLIHAERINSKIYKYLKLYIPQPQYSGQHLEEALAHVRRHLQHSECQLQRLQLALLPPTPAPRLLVLRPQVLVLHVLAQSQDAAQFCVVLE